MGYFWYGVGFSNPGCAAWLIDGILSGVRHGLGFDEDD